jgi:hypothetical protein
VGVTIHGGSKVVRENVEGGEGKANDGEQAA